MCHDESVFLKAHRVLTKFNFLLHLKLTNKFSNFEEKLT